MSAWPSRDRMAVCIFCMERRAPVSILTSNGCLFSLRSDQFLLTKPFSLFSARREISICSPLQSLLRDYCDGDATILNLSDAFLSLLSDVLEGREMVCLSWQRERIAPVNAVASFMVSVLTCLHAMRTLYSTLLWWIICSIITRAASDWCLRCCSSLIIGLPIPPL